MSDSNHTVVTVTTDELHALARFNGRRRWFSAPINPIRAVYFQGLADAVSIANAERRKEIERMDAEQRR